MVLDGREELVAFSLHAVTAESARGQGIFAAVETKNEDDARARGVAAVISVPAESAGRIFLGKLGWAMIDELRLWARPLPRVLRAKASAAQLTRFTHSGDAAAGWPNHVLRDAPYLNWRYLESLAITLRSAEGPNMQSSATSAFVASRWHTSQTSSRANRGRCCVRVSQRCDPARGLCSPYLRTPSAVSMADWDSSRRPSSSTSWGSHSPDA